MILGTYTLNRPTNKRFLKALGGDRGLPLLKEEKRSIALVLTGTFLEYFDVMLYMHLAIILTPRFFPSTDPKMASLLGAFAFCSAYIFRPLGSLVFGYLGDKKGRKAPIVITSVLMGLATLSIGILPSYEAIGVTASICFLIARALQGFSSIGDSIAAKVFTAEVGEGAFCMDFLSMLPDFVMTLGSLAALVISMICLSIDPTNGWRWPFFIGFTVALFSAIIRSKTMESPVFVGVVEDLKQKTANQDAIKFSPLLEIHKKNYWYYFGIEIVPPVAWYFSLRICTDLLSSLGMGTTAVIQHNSLVCATYLVFIGSIGYLSMRVDAFKLLKGRYLAGILSLPLIALCLVFMKHNQSVIFVVQLVVICAFNTPTPALARIINSFPVIGRCTSMGFAYAASHSLVYVFTAMGAAVLQNTFGLWGPGVLLLYAGGISFYCAYRFKPMEDPDNPEGSIELDTPESTSPSEPPSDVVEYPVQYRKRPSKPIMKVPLER